MFQFCESSGPVSGIRNLGHSDDTVYVIGVHTMEYMVTMAELVRATHSRNKSSGTNGQNWTI